MTCTQEYEAKIDQVVDTQYDGDQLLKEAAKELAGIKAARVMSGAYFTRDLFKEFYRKYPTELAYAAGDVLDMANGEL